MLPLSICHLAFFFLSLLSPPPPPSLSERYKLKENKTTSLAFMGLNSCKAGLLVFLLRRGITSQLTLVEHEHGSRRDALHEAYLSTTRGSPQFTFTCFTPCLSWHEQHPWVFLQAGTHVLAHTGVFLPVLLQVDTSRAGEAQRARSAVLFSDGTADIAALRRLCHLDARCLLQLKCHNGVTVPQN